MKTYKIKDKRYDKPLILTEKEFFEMYEYEFKKHNPGVDYEDFIKSWD